MNKDNNNTLCDEYKEHVEKKTQDGVDLDENVKVTVVPKLTDTGNLQKLCTVFL